MSNIKKSLMKKIGSKKYVSIIIIFGLSIFFLVEIAISPRDIIGSICVFLTIIALILQARLKYKETMAKGISILAVITLIGLISVFFNSIHKKQQSRAEKHKRAELITEIKKGNTEINELKEDLRPFYKVAEERFPNIHKKESLEIIATQFYEPHQELEKMLKRIKENKQMHAASIFKIMSLTKQLIKIDNSELKYPLLNYYCEWSTNYRPSGMYAGWLMILQISEAFLEMFHNQNGLENALDTVNQSLSVEQCRLEFIQLYQQYNIPIFLFEQMANWKSFLSILMIDLCKKPIEYPDDTDVLIGRLAELDKRIRNHPYYKPKLFVKKLWLYIDTNNIFELKKGLVCWSLETEFGNQIRSPLCIYKKNVIAIPGEIEP